MDPRDIALQTLTPTVMVPLFGEFVPYQGNGHRFLMAKDGAWIEARRPGIYSRQPLALQDKVAMPYGALAECVELACGQIPMQAVREFVEYARKMMPNEVAMALIWDDQKCKLSPVELKPKSNSVGHITYMRPDLESHQHVVVDIHSHGSADAFFSRTDNKDDRTDVKVAIVVGNLDQEQPSVVARVSTYGHFRPLNINL